MAGQQRDVAAREDVCEACVDLGVHPTNKTNTPSKNNVVFVYNAIYIEVFY